MQTGKKNKQKYTFKFMCLTRYANKKDKEERRIQYTQNLEDLGNFLSLCYSSRLLQFSLFVRLSFSFPLCLGSDSPLLFFPLSQTRTILNCVKCQQLYVLREWPAELLHLVMIVNIDGEERCGTRTRPKAMNLQMYASLRLVFCGQIMIENSLQ